MAKASGKLPNSKSTGPRTSAGKARAARNALTHGLLSRNLLLPEEDPTEWAELLERLLMELDPVGTLEQTLVERIAVAIWRQKRLVRVETARIEVSQRPDVMFRRELEDLVGGNNRNILANILAGVGKREQEAFLEEVIAARQREPNTLDSLREQFPQVWDLLQLHSKAAGDIQRYLEQRHKGEVDNYLAAIDRLYHNILSAYDKAQTRKSAHSLPAAPELMTRYQSALDNDLYKAMRALREAQRFRRESIDSTAQAVVEA